MRRYYSSTETADFNCQFGPALGNLHRKGGSQLSSNRSTHAGRCFEISRRSPQTLALNGALIQRYAALRISAD
jgi:hypothetical protein